MADNISPSGAAWWLGPGSRIGGYVIEKTIASGVAADVFQARDERLQRLAAVKVLSPSLGGDAEFRARFLREYEPVAILDEPHIVPVYGVGEDAGILYIATRFIAGGDLMGLLRQDGRPPPLARLASLIAQVAAALDAVHAAGLVHRGVKPTNILIDHIEGRLERAYLSDLGLTRAALSGGLTPGGAFWNTADFRAAEQAEGSARADRHDLARVAADLFARIMRYQGENHPLAWSAYLQEPVPQAAPFAPELPGMVGEVLRRGMGQDPEARYLSCREFAAALQEAIGSAAPLAGDAAPGSGTVGDADMPDASRPATKPDVNADRSYDVQVGDHNVGVQVGNQNSQANIVDLTGGTANLGPGNTTVHSGASAPQGTAAGSRCPARGRRRAILAGAILVAFAAGTATRFVAFSGLAEGSSAAPPQPAGLTATARTDSSVTIAWSAPASGSRPTLYVIEQDGTLVGSVPGTITTYRVTGLASAATYTYRVVAFQGGHPSPISTALVTQTSTPPPWQAVLTGKQTVGYQVTKVRNFSFSGKTGLPSDTWTFTPKCAASQCLVTVTGAPDRAPFTATLRLSGHAYVGDSQDDNFIYCPVNSTTGTPMSATLALTITVQSGEEASGRWIASSWMGSMTISAPAQSRCGASKVTATISPSG